MHILNRRFAQTAAWAVLPIALFSGLLQPQEIGSPTLQISTQERLETESWWPTMAAAPLEAYVGSAACAGCHAAQNAGVPTGMQRAATSGPAGHFLRTPGAASFASGPLTYSLNADGTRLQLTASNGTRKATQTVDWVMGAGDLAHTFLYESGGNWFQSEVSFYTQPPLLDITTGFGPSASTAPAQALGNLLRPDEARACFGCHTVHATTSAGLNPLHAEPGIGCEACHGPGRQHVDKMAKSSTVAMDRSQGLNIFRPSGLSPSDSIDFCGACHRSFADASLSTGLQADRAGVRFQPARLERSKCWRATQDVRLTCIACHDPHQPLNRDIASYDKNCLQCHEGSKRAKGGEHLAAVCPRATSQCVTCHMPKVNVSSMHGNFTDHDIRIAKDVEPLPQR